MFFMQDNDFTLSARRESSLKYDAASRQIEIYPSRVPVHAVAAPMVRWTEISTAVLSWTCVPTIKLSEHLMLVDLARNDWRASVRRAVATLPI